MKRTLEISYLPHQPPVFDSPARNVVYVKGRRAGGTMGASARLTELAYERRFSRHLWVDTVHRNIDRYVRRYFLPRLRGTRYTWDRGLKELTFSNGSYCDFGSAQRPETLEGFAYDFLWLNEAGIILRNENLYYETLLPMMTEGHDPRMFVIGTPKGGGLFQRMHDWGMDADQPDWASFRHPSAMNPLLNREELERLRDHLPERAYRQEVLAEFVEGDHTVFRDVERIATAEPEQEARPGGAYVLGVDLGRYHDYTVIWVGRLDRAAGVHCERFRGMAWPSQVERIAALSRRFGGAPIYVDATGVGDAVMANLQMADLPVQGVVLSGPRKQVLIDSLALAIEQDRITIIPHPETLRELAAFEHTLLPSGRGRTAAPPGGHDDCVIALALCYWALAGTVNEFILGSRLVAHDTDW